MLVCALTLIYSTDQLPAKVTISAVTEEEYAMLTLPSVPICTGKITFPVPTMLADPMTLMVAAGRKPSGTVIKVPFAVFAVIEKSRALA